jgi:transcription elongation factor Elf1
MKLTKGPAPIPVRHPYFATQCEHCGWSGSSEQCSLSHNWDDADVICPSCNQIFLCNEAPAGRQALSNQEENT